jgi:hypothetical protein
VLIGIVYELWQRNHRGTTLDTDRFAREWFTLNVLHFLSRRGPDQQLHLIETLVGMAAHDRKWDQREADHLPGVLVPGISDRSS